MTTKTIRQQYKEACRLNRLSLNIFIEMKEQEEAGQKHSITWIALQTAYQTHENLLGAYPLPVLSCVAASRPPISFFRNKLGRTANIIRIEGFPYRIGGKKFVFHNGKFVPHIDDRVLEKVS